MHLESIGLHGFKSFGEKIVVKVLPGITGIVGPNGCGKCLEGSTPVALADGRQVAIRDLVEDALAAAPAVHRFDDGVAATGTARPVNVLSLDPTTLRLEPRPVEAFIRREAPPFLLRVTTRSGREIVSTHYHPFFSLAHGALEVLTADQIVAGVRIAVPRTMTVKPIERESLTEAVLSRFDHADRVFVPYSESLDVWLSAAAAKVGGWDALARRVNVPEKSLRCVTRGRPVKVAAIGAVAALGGPAVEIGSLQSASRGRVRLPQEFDERLARFLGYLVAEGRTTPSNQVWFVNSDPAVNADFSRLATELFGITPYAARYKSNAVDTLIFSRALCLLLDRVFAFRWKGKSAEKAVPPQIWTTPNEVIASFLSGLFEGDAFVHASRDGTGRAMPYVEYVTASRRLANDVATLLLRFGVAPLIRRREKYASNTRSRHRRPYWSVLVYGVEPVKHLASQIRFVGAKQRRLDAAMELAVASNPNLDIVPGGAALVREAIVMGGLTVKPLRRSHPRLAAYAEGRCDPSRDGLTETARIIEALGATPRDAAPLLQRMRALAESDVLWDEVVRVERIPPPDPWVYDLTVAETHNFVAANVIAHNSNISEAVRWALGEQSAKSLRGQRMEDLIFHGSASHKPVGLAEVELTFSNEGTLSVPWSEVSVSRRLYRTGESEYLLNNGVTRLRDILDLFAGTGANPRAYSVMDQDKLNHVLTAKPHERRVFIEEAAGIARYKQQRSETQGKLEATRQNLVRVRDVMDEVKRQLGSLERQARKAQQYKILQGEKRELSLALVAADWAALTAEAERLTAELTRLRDAEQGVRTRIAGLASREATYREAIQVSDHRLADLRQNVQKVQGELERLLERREQMGVQIRELDEEAVRLDEDLRIAGERLVALASEREQGRTALADAQAAVNARGTAAAELEAELERHRHGLASERDRLEALRLEQIRLASERTDLMREAGELRERHAQLGRRAERLAAELTEAEAEATQLVSHRTVLESSRDRVVAELTTLAGERERLEALLLTREASLATAEERLANTRLELASRRSSYEALYELERVREGYGAGVRAVFAADGRPAVAGVVGTVADLLEVPPGLERAVEAVLGERLQWVVVERFEHARAAVRHLREHGAGAATFLPLDRLENGGAEHGPPISPPTSDTAGRWAADLVGGVSRPLLRHLLGRVRVVESLDEAEALWQGSEVVATYVTPAGDVLAPSGRLHGGASDAGAGAEHSLLGRKRELRDLEREVARLTAVMEAAQTETAQLDGEVGTLRARLPLLQQSIHAGEAERLAGEKDLEQTVREQERVLRHRETVQAEAREVGLEAEETSATLTVLEQRMTAARDAEAMHERAMVGLRESIENAQDRDLSLVTELTAYRVELASASERVDALGRELARLDQIEADLHERLETTRQRQTQLRDRGAWLTEERERTDVAAREVAVERDRVEEEARAAGQHHEGLVAELRALELEIRAAESEISRIVDAIHEIELRATEGRVRREELVQEAWRGYGVDAEALRSLHDPARDLDAARARVADLEERLAAIGAVNLVADDEYRELDERLTFLRTQHDDLVGSIKDLEKALRGMTRTAQDRFTQAFDEVNRHFGQIFERLFEGGRAELRLVEAEEGGDPLDTGVELMAQPRGKRLQAVSLMSGGERALTGLALLFAIFYFRPSPFCVLDEVDAPLDDANIYRFLRVLRELTSQTQFLVITHNRKTMEEADVLYGVTMEEPGLSKLVSVNLNVA